MRGPIQPPNSTRVLRSKFHEPILQKCTLNFAVQILQEKLEKGEERTSEFLFRALFINLLLVRTIFHYFTCYSVNNFCVCLHTRQILTQMTTVSRAMNKLSSSRMKHVISFIMVLCLFSSFAGVSGRLGDNLGARRNELSDEANNKINDAKSTKSTNSTDSTKFTEDISDAINDITESHRSFIPVWEGQYQQTCKPYGDGAYQDDWFDNDDAAVKLHRNGMRTLAVACDTRDTGPNPHNLTYPSPYVLSSFTVAHDVPWEALNGTFVNVNGNLLVQNKTGHHYTFAPAPIKYGYDFGYLASCFGVQTTYYSSTNASVFAHCWNSEPIPYFKWVPTNYVGNPQTDLLSVVSGQLGKFYG